MKPLKIKKTDTEPLENKADAEHLKEETDAKSSKKKTEKKVDAKPSRKKPGKKSPEEKTKARMRFLFWISVILIILACGSLLLVPRAGKEILEGVQTTAIAIAVMFWGFELVAYIIQFIISGMRKKAAQTKTPPQKVKRRLNKGSVVALGVAIAALAGLIVSIVYSIQDGLLITLSAAILLAAVQIGLLFGGNNYTIN